MTGNTQISFEDFANNIFGRCSSLPFLTASPFSLLRNILCDLSSGISLFDVLSTSLNVNMKFHLFLSLSFLLFRLTGTVNHMDLPPRCSDAYGNGSSKISKIIYVLYMYMLKLKYIFLIMCSDSDFLCFRRLHYNEMVSGVDSTQ